MESSVNLRLVECSCPMIRRCRAGAALALLAAGLAGCAVVPPGAVPHPLARPESLAATQSLATREGQGAWPSDGWWQAYGDPQLDALIAEGLTGATDLRVAEARFARAQAASGEARSRLLPGVGASAEGGVAQQSDNYLFPKGFAPRGWPEFGQGVLSLNWEIDFWGKNRAALAAARGEAEAARAEAAAARLAVSAGIAAAYADLAELYAQRDAAAEAVKVRRQTEVLLAGRQRQGLENMGAVERAASARAGAEGDLAAADEALVLARHRLAALMGAGPDRGLAIARPAVKLGAGLGLPANLPADLLGRRPDIIAARARAEAASARVRGARASFYPNINLAALVGVQAMGLNNVFKTGSDFGSVAPSLTLPILDGGQLRSRFRSAEADHLAAVAQYDGTLVQALREVADAAASRQALALRLDRAQAAERSAQAAWQVANNRYRGALATYLDVLAAEDALIGARRTVASLQTRAFALDVALIRALGGGYRA